MKLQVMTILMAFSLSAQAAWLVKQVKPSKDAKNSQAKIINVRHIDSTVDSIKVLRSLPEEIIEHSNHKSAWYQEVVYPENKLPKYIKAWKKQTSNIKFNDTEVRTIIKQGKDNNRITLTILGDGYTSQEKSKFFEDVNRLVDDMFIGSTFKSYLPMFNIYAVFTASKDSGITDRASKDTAFGLYRSPAGSKRGIMPGNRSAIERALDLAPAYANYPIIIANDDYYGGLGGRYAITTRSLQSGTMVLAHELGHNFSNVGEEYDGGQVYSGANFSRDGSKWNHWKDHARHEETNRNEFVMGAYVWQNLSKPFKKSFNFNKTGHKLGLKISSVGWETENDVEVLVNGQRVKLNGVFTDDRTFYRTQLVDLTAGKHTVEIRQLKRDGNNVLAYANAYAYPASYDFTADKVAAYAVFANGRRFKGYRPTENQCLMRDMRSKEFCAVDQENIWVEFFKRVKLIDGVKIEGSTVSVETPNLKDIEIKWFRRIQRAEQEIVELRGKTSWEKKTSSNGVYRVEVKFTSDEVRLNSPNFTDSREFNL